MPRKVMEGSDGEAGSSDGRTEGEVTEVQSWQAAREIRPISFAGNAYRGNAYLMLVLAA